MRNSRYKKASSRIARRGKTKRFFGLFLKIGLPVVFLVGFILFLRADFLQIKNFKIVGTETLSEESIKNMASSFATGTKFFLIPKSNILILNKAKLEQTLLSNFGRLEKVEINKKFFSQQIQIKVTERQADFLWCSSGDECFSMTKDGLVFEKVDSNSPATASASLGQISFEGNLEGNPLMKNFATPAKIQNYINFANAFKNVGFSVNSINIESVDKAVAKTNIGDIIFNPEEVDLSLTAQNTILLINEVKGKNPSAKFNYIDARFDNKFFYKLY